MSTILQYPDSLSLSGNLKKFSISSSAEVTFVLQQGATVILTEKYQPDADDLVTVDVKAIIERLLEIVVPTDSDIVTEQILAVLDFSATIDAHTPIAFRVIKGGVAEMTEITASQWIEAHFLTWQPQEKKIIQEAPEWLGIYPLEAGTIEVTAYFGDGNDYTGTYAILEANKLYSINTSWGEIAEWLTALSEGSGSGSGSGVGAILGDRPIAWDVWFEVSSTRMTPVQRYLLRNAGDEEHLFVWVNTVGGIDSVSFTGYNEDDEKLEHQNALYDDETIGEYDIKKPREVRQSTGYLDNEESFWLKDFFYSRKKYMVRADGSLKQIAVVGSKIISQSSIDEFDYEFTYRYGADGQLLNLERTHTPLPAPEGLENFFLTELLSELTEASYQDNLIMAVQSPYAIGWQKLSMSQLWGGALPGLVDGKTIVFRNGKLTAIAAEGGEGGEPAGDFRTELISGTIVWRSGLTYQSTIIEYKILGVHYTAQPRLMTLDPSDPNLARIDAFYLDIYGNVNFRTGTPAVNPASPVITSKELEVMTVLIAAGALEPSNVSVTKIYDEYVEGEWAFSETHDDYVLVDPESTEEPYNGAKRLKVKINSPIIINDHYLGEKYRGGIIFYIDPTSNGKRGLIAAESDTAVDVYYESLSGGAPYSTGASGITIGTGKPNSVILLAHPRAKDHAVKYCNELVIDGYDDWFLPSEDEMMAMYINRFKIGNFANKEYWTSTEVTGRYDWNKARTFGFAAGIAYTNKKNIGFNVRAIRAFDDVNDEPEDSPDAFYPTSNTKLTFVSAIPVPVKEGILSLYPKSTLPWRANSMLLIEAFLGVEQVGYVAMSVTNLFYYKPSDDTWQMVAIQMYQFAPTKNTIDSFRISLIGSWPNLLDLGFDDIRFQYSNIVVTDAVKLSYDKTDYNFVEDPDDFRTEFTTIYPFIPGTSKVHLNGVRQIKGEGEHYDEVEDKIVFDYPPEYDSGFVIDYKTLVKP